MRQSFEDERGWHKYPPASSSSKDDEVGLSAPRTFEMVLRLTRKSKAPAARVLLLRSSQGTYVTLHRSRFRSMCREAQRLHKTGATQSAAPTRPQRQHALPVKSQYYFVSSDRATTKANPLHRFIHEMFLGSAGVRYCVNRICRLEVSPGEN